jgi:uncharacterized protein YgfB (UPF0149 family)
MKIGESRVQDISLQQLQNDKSIKKQKTDNTSSVALPTETESGLSSKNASFVGEIKALNETMLGIGLAESSIRQVNGDKMEEAVKSLRDITTTLKDILARNFAKTNENSEQYGVEAVKAKLYGTNPSNLHDFDYLSTKAASLLA